MSAPFGPHVRRHSMSKCYLPHQCWKCLVVIFLLVTHVHDDIMVDFGGELFFYTLIFSLHFLSKYKCVLSFVFFFSNLVFVFLLLFFFYIFNWFFLIMFFIIWFHLIFISNLVFIVFIVWFFFIVFLINFFFQFHP